MTEFDPADFEETLIAEMRAHGGDVTTGPLAGHPLLILTSAGAKSGDPRRVILTASRDGNDYIVAGTAGGSPKTPAWVYNVREHPDVTIEAGNRVSRATAAVIDDQAERDRLWTQHVERLPHFAEYPSKTKRVIPVIRISPRDQARRVQAGTDDSTASGRSEGHR